MNIQEFLEQNGYRNWKVDKQGYGTTTHYQKRIDIIQEYEHYPLCECNDKLFINIVHSEFTINGREHVSFEMSLVHENKAGNWCNLKIYSLTEEKVTANLQKYEKLILELWNVFYCGGE